MTKVLLSVLVLVAIVALLYFSFSKQISDKFLGTNPTPGPQSVIVEKPIRPATPSPTASPEDDLTALERDLTELQATDVSLGNDLNNL
ncbi:hypothetical protein A2617_04430 [Candidatus Daviesbacteria bacterium RIFOXYD1_FULL_41_10]|uniref:Uncharacterized protein n=2 Tax=Candidatus Daviesiibacteriota TaxID=1752718 RepID=A0A1F5N0N0_9BACT|nr:MAG: hypothetical protein UU67_C0012G0010 [Candidatus Daviesbacteria bacterium GW2011_GWB1_41_5]OGE71142.1 MAG: hypothetical protein A2617_04430 [Candidatus Daviesbacteria bacterium RIFOXYD1_FULL_41_10]